MGLLAPALAVDGGRAPWDDYWYESRTIESISGVRVDANATLAWSAMYAAVSYVAEDIGKVACDMFERTAEGKEPAPDHWLQEKLHDEPNDYQTAIEFREMMTAFSILRAEGVAEVRPGTRGLLDAQIVPLHPDLLRAETVNHVRRHVYRDPLNDLRPRTILDEDLVILRGRLGRGLVDVARDSVGNELALQRSVGLLFARGALRSGVVSRPQGVGWDDVTRQAFRKSLNEYSINGSRAGRPLLLEDGMTWEDASLTPTDAQLLEQMRFGITEASRWVRIPPHKLMELTRSTNNNIDRQSIDYVVDTLLGWAIRWEQVIYRDLLMPEERGRIFAKLNLDALMRGDPAARAAAYALAIQWGWMTRNEVRDKENLNKLPGLDGALTPLNMTTDGKGNAKVQYASRAPVVGQLRLLASDAAQRVVRREVAAVAKLAERTGASGDAWAAGVDELYREHAEYVADALHIPGQQALGYARRQRAELLASGPAVTDSWLVERVDELSTLAMDQEAIAA